MTPDELQRLLLYRGDAERGLSVPPQIALLLFDELVRLQADNERRAKIDKAARDVVDAWADHVEEADYFRMRDAVSVLEAALILRAALDAGTDPNPEPPKLCPKCERGWTLDVQGEDHRCSVCGGTGVDPNPEPTTKPCPNPLCDNGDEGGPELGPDVPCHVCSPDGVKLGSGRVPVEEQRGNEKPCTPR